MKKEITIAFYLLTTLTIISIVIYNDGLFQKHHNLLIAAVAYIKIILVSYYFMGLNNTHSFWKVSVTGLTGLLLLSSVF